MKAIIPKALLAVAFAGAATVASAQITGSLYEHTGSSPWPSPPGGISGATADIPIPSGLTPDVTFTVPNGSLNFDSRSGGNNSANYTAGSWLGTGGATIVTGSSGALSTSLDNTIVTLSGFVTMTHGETFTVAHDDGLVLDIGGQDVVNVPGPTSPTDTTSTAFAGADGNYAFTLEYSEINGAPAVLAVDLPLTATPTVPDASTTMGMLSLGLGGLAAFGRRFRK